MYKSLFYVLVVTNFYFILLLDVKIILRLFRRENMYKKFNFHIRIILSRELQ